jgi:type I restriction enzyme S subunit
VDACRERLDRVPGILQSFRRSVLQAATDGQLTEQWRNDEPHVWPTVRLDAVATGFSYGSAAKSAAQGDVPVLRMGNIQGGRLDWNNLVFTSEKAEITKYALAPGDVLFNRTNSPELVGKTAVYKGERPAIYAGYLIRVRCTDRLLPDYLNYCLGSPAGRDYCWQVKSDGVSQSNINATKLAAFEFLLPPLEEQREIVRRVESLFALADAIEARYQVARAQVEKLTPALLAKAFRGELVPQDPNDEPAAVMLERVKAERALGAPARKAGRRSRTSAENTAS